MKVKVNLLENQKLKATYRGFEIICDQPQENGGDDSAPGPYDYFVISLSMCATYFVRSFCQARKINTDGLEIFMDANKDSEGKANFNIGLQLPNDFPSKYREAVLKAIEGCSIKKAIENGPQFSIHIRE